MIFSRLLPLFALALSFSFVSVAKPIAEAGVVKRAGPDVAAILASLKAESDSVLPQINALIDSDNGSLDNIEPLFHHLVNAFETATESLTDYKGTVFTLQSGPTKADAAAVIASIVTDVATTLKKLPVEGRILLPTLLSVLDLAMKNFLSSVEGNLGGTLVLLTGLLDDKAILFTTVGLIRVASLLGLL